MCVAHRLMPNANSFRIESCPYPTQIFHDTFASKPITSDSYIFDENDGLTSNANEQFCTSTVEAATKIHNYGQEKKR